MKKRIEILVYNIDFRYINITEFEENFPEFLSKFIKYSIHSELRGILEGAKEILSVNSVRNRARAIEYIDDRIIRLRNGKIEDLGI